MMPDDWFRFKDVPLRRAAAGVLVSGENDSEVLMVRRNPDLAFMGGHHAFPGGAVDKEETRGLVSGVDDPEDALYVYTVVREVFEETGLMLAEGTLPDLETLRRLRHELIAEERPFADMLEELGLRINGQDFEPAGLWITPAFSPKRFHTRYYLVRYRGERYQEPAAPDAEIVETEWMLPSEARRRWHANELRLSTPVAFVLRHLAAIPLPDVLPMLQDTPGLDEIGTNRFEPRPGIHVVPLRTDTLPPGTHTTSLVIGEREMYVTDPGAADGGVQQELKEHLDHLVNLGGRIVAVLLTHGHGDHTGAADFIRETYGAKVWAHPRTASEIGIAVDRELEDGAVIPVAGDIEWRIRCIHTPGHDPGHLCYLEETTGTLYCGDMFANPGTIVISPDFGGDMTHYLESLEKLLQEKFNFLVPSHGLPIWGGGGHRALQGLIDHRLEREEKIKTALDDGAKTAEAIIERAYEDTPREAWPLAEHQLRAHLQRLGVTLDA